MLEQWDLRDGLHQIFKRHSRELRPWDDDQNEDFQKEVKDFINQAYAKDQSKGMSSVFLTDHSYNGPKLMTLNG